MTNICMRRDGKEELQRHSSTFIVKFLAIYYAN